MGSWLLHSSSTFRQRKITFRTQQREALRRKRGAEEADFAVDLGFGGANLCSFCFSALQRAGPISDRSCGSCERGARRRRVDLQRISLAGTHHLLSGAREVRAPSPVQFDIPIVLAGFCDCVFPILIASVWRRRSSC
jgi:hypothetical protein